MKPNLIIVGAQKSGTGSLHHYLNLHPEVSMSETKELNFFVETLNWEKGLDWYESRFTGVQKIHGESSPSYTMYPNFPGVPARMHAILPDARLIYVVRDPLERIVSHYLHQWYGKRQDAPFLELLADPENKKTRHYILTSSYYLQLSQYTEFYDLSKICVISLEDLKNSRPETLGRIYRFLEIDDSFLPIDSTAVVNRTQTKLRTNLFGDLLLSDSPAVKSLRETTALLLPGSIKARLRSLLGSKQTPPEITPEIRQVLGDALRDDISKFRELTGQSFSQWSL